MIRALTRRGGVGGLVPGPLLPELADGPPAVVV